MDKTNAGRSPESKNADLFLALLPLVFMGNYYGLRALALSCTAVAAAVVTDITCVLLRRQRLVKDFSAPVTGLAVAMMMPASVSYHVLIFASVFGVALIKHVFGGRDAYIFSPAAAAYAFASISWPSQVLLYPQPFSDLPVWGAVTANLSPSFERTLNLGAVPNVSYMDLFLGQFLGPMGATHVLVLLVCVFCLMLRRSISPEVFLGSAGVIAAIAWFFPRVGVTHMQSVANELFGGVVLFVLIFLASDPATLPESRTGRLWYGVTFGAFVVAFRYFGRSEGAAAFALLIVNALSDGFNSRAWRFLSAIRASVNALERRQVSQAHPDKDGEGGEPA